MQNRIRLEDVAQTAGVSTATVSRALSLPDRVRPETLERVRRAVQKLGYVPDAAGRALASGRTKTVGCVIPTLDHAIFASSTHAMQTLWCSSVCCQHAVFQSCTTIDGCFLLPEDTLGKRLCDPRLAQCPEVSVHPRCHSHAIGKHRISSRTCLCELNLSSVMLQIIASHTHC